MHLVASGMIDPRVTLVTRRAVGGICRPRDLPGGCNQLVFEVGLAIEETVE
jgi:hypothetical protein